MDSRVKQVREPNTRMEHGSGQPDAAAGAIDCFSRLALRLREAEHPGERELVS